MFGSKRKDENVESVAPEALDPPADDTPTVESASPAIVPGELYFRKGFVMDRLTAYRESLLARVRKASDYQLLLDVSRETQLLLDAFDIAGEPLPVTPQ